MDINEIAEEFSFRGISKIIAELGLWDARFVFDESNHEIGNRIPILGGTFIKRIGYEDLGNGRCSLHIEYDKPIKLFINQIKFFIEDLCDALSTTNENVKTSLLFGCVENSMVRELKYLYYYKNLSLKLTDVDSSDTFEMSLNAPSKFILDKKATEFMLSKR